MGVFTKYYLLKKNPKNICKTIDKNNILIYNNINKNKIKI